MPFLDRSPLEYQVNTATSIRRWEDTRPPVSGVNGDYKQFRIGDHWIDTTAQLWWILCYKDSTQGIWKSCGTTPGGLDFLTGDAGGAVGPDGLNNINIIGGAGVTVIGNPVTNTLSVGLTGGGLAIDTVTGDVGGAVSPDGAGNLNVIGGAGIVVTGNPGLNTLTVALTGGGNAIDTVTTDDTNIVPPDALGNINYLGDTGIYLNGIYFFGDVANNVVSARDLRNITVYVVDPTILETEYQTIQAALDAANAAGGGTVWIRPGTYTEDLTLYDAVDLVGAAATPAGGATIIIGAHTPPVAGSFSIRNLALQDDANILFSAAAGTTTIAFIDCTFEITNGTSINMGNWTGLIATFNCHSIGTIDSYINIGAGAANFIALNCTIGVGAGPAVLGGANRIDNCRIECAMTWVGSAEGMISSSRMSMPWLVNNDATAICCDTFYLNTKGLIFLNTTSTGSVTLANVTISSLVQQANVIIGTGTVIFSNVNFLQTNTIDDTIVQQSNTYERTGPTEIIPIDSTAAADDAWLRFAIKGNPEVMAYSIGIDNSSANNDLKITDGASPSAGNEIIKVDGASLAITFDNAYTFPVVDGAANEVLTTDGAGNVSWAASAGASRVVQYVYTSKAAWQNCTTIIPLDNTIPQQAEGDEILTLSITPTNANNLLIIKFNSFGSISSTTVGTFALFRDAGANAIAATAPLSTPIGEYWGNYSLNHTLIAGAIGATTFKIRGGPHIAKNLYINGSSFGVVFGGVASTTLEIWELLP